MPISASSVLRLRIPLGENIAIGPGKAALLEAIDETGSISAAGRKLNMSYRKAWLVVKDMNRFFRKPLVDAAKGGAKGGGAHLTEMGRVVVEKYRGLEKIAIGSISGELEDFEGLLNDLDSI